MLKPSFDFSDQNCKTSTKLKAPRQGGGFMTSACLEYITAYRHKSIGCGEGKK